ncbi:MAG: cation transporter [Flavobacterium sp.]|nr:cation transporter [Flavobacterium sp.]
MKNIVLILCMVFVGLSAQAQEKKNKNAKHSIEVNGNCEQCKKRIEKAAYSVSGVKSAVWSVETHQLSLIVNEEKTSISVVKKAIAKVGHDTDEEKATDEVYDNLHHCCRYERKK